MKKTIKLVVILGLSIQSACLPADLDFFDTNENIELIPTIKDGGYQGLEFCTPCWPWDEKCLKEFNECSKRNLKKTTDFIAKTGQEFLSTVRTGITKVGLFLATPIKNQIKKDQLSIVNNPYKNTIANVRRGGIVGPDEQAFRTERLKHVKKSLEQIFALELKDNEVPEIVVSLSGGGVRALVGSLGAMIGLQESGIPDNKPSILDTVMTIATLSGSTWLIAPYLVSNVHSFREFKEILKPRLSKMLLPEGDDARFIIDAILTKVAFDQPIDLIDFYGGQLANALLADRTDRNRIYISSQADKIRNGSYFMPVYTCQLADFELKKEWFEVTPFETGSRWIDMYVPTWAMGRRFNNGVSQDFAPEQTIGYYMGLFGSAFAADFKRAYGALLAKIKLPLITDFLQALVNETTASNIRLTWAELNNYAYKLGNNPLAKKEVIKLADAGIGDVGSPTFAAYRDRTPDVVIIVNLSDGSAAAQLKALSTQAQRRGFKFPANTHTDEELERNAVTLIQDINDPETPTVIYISRVSDAQLLASHQNDPAFAAYKEKLSSFDALKCIRTDYCKTFNLDYTPAQVDESSMLMEFNIKASMDKIKQAIKERIDRKKGLTK